MAARRSYAIFQDVCRLFPSANPGFSPSTRDWRDGLGWQNWRFDAGTPLGARERKALRARTDSDRAQRESAIARRHAETSARAARIWAASLPAADDHAYLRFKGIQAHGLRVFKGALVVPLRDATGHLCSLQFIGAGGAKRFLKGGRVAGCFCLVGGVSDTVCVAEGFATAASLHAATGHAVAVAFSAGNLAAAAEALRARHSGVRLIVCADDDGATPGNPGLTRARDTARATGALLAVPVTGDDRPPELSDFNDLHRLFGLQAVRDAVAAARPVGREELPARTPPAIGSALREWSDPEPLTEPLEAHPYPVQALPTRLRDAVRDVQAFVQARRW